VTRYSAAIEAAIAKARASRDLRTVEVEAKIIDEHLIAVTFADGLRGKVHMGRLIKGAPQGLCAKQR
jgi:hypothetical protein